MTEVHYLHTSPVLVRAISEAQRPYFHVEYATKIISKTESYMSVVLRAGRTQFQICLLVRVAGFNFDGISHVKLELILASEEVLPPAV